MELDFSKPEILAGGRYSASCYQQCTIFFKEDTHLLDPEGPLGLCLTVSLLSAKAFIESLAKTTCAPGSLLLWEKKLAITVCFSEGQREGLHRKSTEDELESERSRKPTEPAALWDLARRRA